MAIRYWVGGSGEWNATDTTHWASSSGGAGGASVPSTGADETIFNNASGGGVVTANTDIDILSITMGLFTGTLDFSVHNNDVTLQKMNGSGTATRGLKLGDGTWTIDGANVAPWVFTAVNNLTLNPGNAQINLFYTGNRQAVFAGGGAAWPNLRLAAANEGAWLLQGSNTYAKLELIAPILVYAQYAVTQNITDTFHWSGNGGAGDYIFLSSNDPSGQYPATISAPAGGTIDWGILRAVAFTGGGAKAADNTVDLGRNSGITITPPDYV